MKTETISNRFQIWGIVEARETRYSQREGVIELFTDFEIIPYNEFLTGVVGFVRNDHER